MWNRSAPALAVAVVLCSVRAFAGPLNPPVGPVAPTPGPEPRIAVSAINTPGDADSLFKISQPGSYYLTGNVTGVVGKHGIEIAATGVTLDLNGFELRGVAGSLDGVSATGSDASNLAVRNGSVREWGGDGVDLTATSSATNTVVDVIASANGGDGIVVSFRSMVSRCVATDNGGNGFVSQTSATISECIANANLGDGFNVASNCAISVCAAFENGGDGFQGGSSVSITNCSADRNTLNGIQLNTACTITGCAVLSNDAIGIRTNDGCVITNCSSRTNQLDGIYVTDSCIVMFNTSSANGSAGFGAGIHAVGVDNRIEANNCMTSDIGIDVDSAGNFIARNVCSGNGSNWEVAVGNVCFVVLATNTGVAISGDSGGVSPGSTNPNANYSY